MNTDRIESLVVTLSTDPHNPELNFLVAEEYASHNQWASAVSFYLRCMEFGHESHPLHVYTSLLQLSKAFDTQNDRQWTVSGALLQAAGYLPDRPEAWFFLSRFNERLGNWQEAYTFAEIGLKAISPFQLPLPAGTDYLGQFCLEFEKAVSGWWIGRRDESILLLTKLSHDDIPAEYKNSVLSNLERVRQ